VSATRATKIAGNKRFRQDSAYALVALATQLGPDYPTLALPERRSVNTRCWRRRYRRRKRWARSWLGAQHRLAAPISRSWLSGWRQPVLLKVGDDVSTDEISAAGAHALPFRLNISKLAELAFTVMVKAVERKQGMVLSAMLTARW
jgi:hypothetical protein